MAMQMKQKFRTNDFDLVPFFGSCFFLFSFPPFSKSIRVNGVSVKCPHIKAVEEKKNPETPNFFPSLFFSRREGITTQKRKEKKKKEEKE